ncbi:zinc finger protein ZFP2-like [Battus philenor]|uniref:zinc finger protein ZFP2-like n=1 Tax=Battus philenor TaxID=42288 RepID=UPI0035D0DF45
MASSRKKIEIKIEELCRTCLAKETELFPIFDIFFDATTLNDVISSITGVKIDKSDGLPTKICQECKDKAANAYEFKRKSQEADVALHGIFKKEKAFLVSDKSLLSETNQDIDVKLENYPQDDNEEYIDLEYNLDLPIPNNGFSDMDVKNEMSMDNSLEAKNCNPDIDSDNSQEQIKEKCIKVEYEYNSSTFCPLCGTCYVDSDGLTKHMWDSHAEIMGPKKRGRPKKMVTDTILNKLSENGYYLKTVPVKRLSCSFCKEKFKTKEELVTHMAEHKETKVLCCVICKKMYLKKNYFDIHLCIEDKTQGSHLQENDPPIVLPSKNEQDEFMIETSLHQLLDLSNNPEACTSWQACGACSALLATPAALADHVDALHPELSLRCALCNKLFATVKSASRHRSKCASVERAHECTSCGQRFAHEVSLNKHILHSHAGQSVSVKFVAREVTDGQRYQCDTCNRCFFRKDLLARHAKNHKSNDKFYECDICKKRFHRSDNLRSHMRVHGSASGGAASGACLCLYCGRSFTNSSNLIVHMRRHTGEKPYKCDFCDKGFPRSSDLQCHRRSHTGEKPYICGVCGKGFSRSNKLSRHMRVHTGHRPYKCPYCEKAFSQSNDLNLHVRRHTGDKPYICEICGDRFIQGTALHNHRRTHGHYPPNSTPAPLPAALSTPLFTPIPPQLSIPPPAQITTRPRR